MPLENTATNFKVTDLPDGTYKIQPNDHGSTGEWIKADDSAFVDAER